MYTTNIWRYTLFFYINFHHYVNTYYNAWLIFQFPQHSVLPPNSPGRNEQLLSNWLLFRTFGRLKTDLEVVKTHILTAPNLVGIRKFSIWTSEGNLFLTSSSFSFCTMKSHYCVRHKCANRPTIQRSVTNFIFA